MKHLKLFFALFAMLALGVTNAWAAEETITLSSFGWSNASVQSSIAATTATITLQQNGASTAPTYYTADGLRLYGVKSATTGGTISFTPKTGITISKIVFTHGASNSGVLAIKTGGGSYSSKTWSGTLTEGNSVSLVSTNSGSKNPQVKITKIVITYENSGSEETAYSVTVNQPANGTISATGLTDGKAAEGTIVKLTATPDAGYKWESWTVTGASGDVVVSNNQFTMPAEDVTVTASFVPKTQYSVAWKVSDEDADGGSTSATEGDKVAALPNTPDDCSGDVVFVGWSDQEVSDGNKPALLFTDLAGSPEITGNTTFYAVFAKQGEGGTDGSVTITHNSTNFPGSYGTANAFTEYTLEGYRFMIQQVYKNGKMQWRAQGNSNGTGTIYNSEVFPSAITSIVVVFDNSDANKNHTLKVGNTANPTSGTSITPSISGNTYTFDCSGDSYNYFVLTNGSGAGYTSSVTINYGVAQSYSDYSTSCTVEQDYTITIADDIEHGTVTAPATAKAGATITLTATADENYSFGTWSVTEEGGKAVTVSGNQFTMPEANVTVSATFKEIPAATLTLSKNGDTSDKIVGKVGDVITLPTFTSDCSKTFVGWDADENCNHAPTYAPGAEFELTATEHTLYAVYGTQTGGGEGVLTKMTSTDAFANGDKVVIVAYGTQLGMYQETSGTTYVKYWELVGNEPTVAELDEKTIWDVEAIGENWKIGDATIGYLYNASSNNLAVSTTNASTWTITWKENGFVFKSDLDRYMACRTDLTTSSKNLYRMNGTSVSNNSTYEMDVYKYTSSAPIYSEFSTTCSAAPDAPVFSVGTGTYNEAQTVSITAEEGATIHYTLNGNNPTDKSDVYSSALTISETTTLKAIAVKDGLSSAITTATYTIKLPLTTIDQIFARAKEVDGTATAVEITMGGWTVSGANDKNVFVTDGTKGFIIYKSDGGHGFNVGDVLSGTVACKVQLFKGSAELTELTSTTSGLTVTTGGTVAPVTLDAAGITALTGVNTGSVIKINGTCTLENSKYYVAGVQLYNTLYEFQTLEPSAEYNVTGVYQLYTTTKEILPRQEADIEKIESLPTATISIADITMEVEETKTITATIYPAAAAAAVVYSTTSSCISISGNTITALTEGTATVTATIADSDDKYYGATKDFTVTVTPKSTKDKVVILAKYGDQWYAMMAQYVSGKTSHLAALPVTYVGGKLYNVADADKTLIEWERAVVDGKATFSNNSKYLTGKSDKTDLTLAATSCDWTISGESYLIGERTFFYNAENNWFRNFGTSNAGNKNYSGMPTVTAPVYATGDAYGRSVNLGEDGYRYGTICLPFGSTNFTGAEFFECVGKEEGKVYIASVTTLVAGTPYIFLASATEVAVYGDGTTAATPGSKNGLVGTFTNDTEVAIGKYILKDNALCQAEATCWVNANRAYLVMEDVPGEFTKMPGRKYIGMSTKGENAATSLDNITNGENTTIKVIENGQLIIIRNGEKFNAQGQRL